MSMNLCMGSYHCSSTMPDCSAPHRYLWPVYGFLTADRRRDKEEMLIPGVEEPEPKTQNLRKSTN